MLRGFREWARFFLWPSLPYQVLEVVFPDRIEAYYEGYDEVRVYSSRGGYMVTVVPRESRSDAPGPISFASSHDPWSVGVLVTPFYLFRGLVIMWAILWFTIIYALTFYVFNFLFTPPVREVNIPPYGRIAIPDPLWKPDPVQQALWIILIGFLVMYYVFHLLRFMQPTVKYSTLITIGSVSGVYYTVPAPEPLTTIKITDFLRLVGDKLRSFELETVHVLVGVLPNVMRENKALREQTIACLEGYRRLGEVQDVASDVIVKQQVLRMFSRKPLLFLLLTIIPFIIGLVVGLIVSGGVAIEQPTP